MRILLTGLILSFSISSFSQLDFSGGLELGLSSSQVSGDGLSGFDKFGLSGGPYVRASWNDNSTARMSILYVNKGSRKNANPKRNDFRIYALRLNYLEVPLLYNYSYQEKYRAEAGIAIGTLLSGTEVENGQEIALIEPFKSYEVSMVFGINYLFSDKLFANLRYTNSIIPVRDGPDTGNTFSFYEAGQYNSVLQVMIGLEF